MTTLSPLIDTQYRTRSITPQNQVSFSPLKNSVVQSKHLIKSSNSLTKQSVLQKYNIQNKICDKNEHDDQKIAFICLQSTCRAQKRVGCATCFLEEHPDHNFVKIEELTNQYQQMNLLCQDGCKKLVDEVKVSCELMNSKFRKLMDEQKHNIVSHFSQQIIYGNPENSDTQFQEIKVENVTDMSKENQDQLVEQFKRIQSAPYKQSENDMQLQNFVQTYNTFWKSQVNILQVRLEQLFKNLCFSLPTYQNNNEQKKPLQQIPPSDKFIIKTPEKIDINNLLKKNNGVSKIQTSLPFQPVERLYQPESYTAIKPTQNIEPFQRQNYQIPPSNLAQNIYKTTSVQNSPMKNIIKSQKTPTLNSQASESVRTQRSTSTNQPVQKPNNEKQFLINLRRFYTAKLETMSIYRAQCKHAPKSALLSVFSCCNNAYPCSKCHDALEAHKRKIDYPSRRFCLKCLEFYSAECTQEVHVYCPTCEVKKKE